MTVGKYQHMCPFSRVVEVHQNDYEEFSGYRSVALIVPARSGRRRRYHTYRLNLNKGDLTMIGNELTLGHSRKIAKRSMYEDPPVRK